MASSRVRLENLLGDFLDRVSRISKEEALMIAAAMLYAKNAEFPYEVRIKDEKVSTKIADISNVVISRK